ncbi:MAG: hypothetical protein A3B91_04045 [Candidatus Yanofskybacteria bacterium RIFCSPHIGHO2_02_FULL_41_29]|uniref:HAD family hydrolase n=1 Tax=Candidatus Yanofskybacteria bacterium RIFCSPHIGHO2_01_FULL_41_53 TaxID=1802663 RepID=A0A1F8ELW9_9BACT|nr:MAG: hypothetical protein A2650_04825 [Candidatus Yanofskybacteria bacterium RIFCSPHIGHO2_01_FULL_41_53]OGN12619.1 MAG: hypothetical protein A3B91_04045 [Candidatus Yanofskybacteria bacterium RIFCSPHIGHO2_02_FULL_41_29]OGN17791.1 MAG: hypothetical protein A3F48_02495 [Candidatus Yanofskybacteria bacterium RIFCSPHIGHO2_12_FULL_41_9]OGN24842.1 MAG: hypothetical protein A2916_04470 [Candidatus Yanofskybacteria bacterium RIFCSPLOWO2_01_FULL_41_67]OGN29001.1 MAG: hypothetical protein A3H54_03315 
MIKAVIFDWNGTLFDDLEKLAYGSVKEIFRCYNIPPPTLEQYRQEITSSFMAFYYKYGFAENFSGQEAKGDADALNQIRKKYYTEHKSDGQIRPDARDTILRLKEMNIKIGIVSAEIRASLFEKLNSSELRDQFDPKLIIAEAWSGKDLALLDICDKLAIQPGNAIYVDDTIDGINSAKKAGLIPVGFGNKTGYNSERRLRQITSLVVNELSELIPLISRTTNFEIYPS